MNAKKHRRRATKLTQKVDRGSQNRRAVEGKTNNIGAKRVTLLPGFLINGFTTNTVQKVKDLDDSRKKKNHLLNEDLQAFLEQKGKHPRRSQRILKKHVEQQFVTPSSGGHHDNFLSTPVNLRPQDFNNLPNNISFKSILKNNSKSLFRDISDRFSKVKIHSNVERGSQKPIPMEENLNVRQDFNYMEEVNNQGNPETRYLSQGGFNEGIVMPETQSFIRIDLNQLFCRNLEKQISVTFKRNVIDECRENITKRIERVNMALEGKVELEKMVVHDSEENQTGFEGNRNVPSPKLYPVQPHNWIYSTPPNQKIGVPQIEESNQLQAAILCQKNNQQNLYEVKPSFTVDFTKLRNMEHVPIDDRFMRKVAQVKKTPANFGNRRYKEDNREPNLFPQAWREPAQCGGSAEMGGQQESFLNPNFINVITRPMKLRKPITFPNYLEEHMPTPQVLTDTNLNFTELHDFTFIEEGNDFKMQESQPAVEQRNKRRLSEEEFVIKRRNVFIPEQSICDKMFDFGSQKRNMFDFGKV